MAKHFFIHNDILNKAIYFNKLSYDLTYEENSSSISADGTKNKVPV
jgi:hypothetical protein